MTTFDSGNRSVKRHNVAWKNPISAACFAADVADRVLARVSLGDTDRQVLTDMLRVSRQLAVWQLTDDTPMDDPIMTMHVPELYAAFAAYHAWRQANENSRLGSTLGALVSAVNKLFWKPSRSAAVVANDAGRWVYTWAMDTAAITEGEIEEIEMARRLTDRATPPSENLRLAFEAVWHTGDYRRAIKLLHQKERR